MTKNFPPPTLSFIPENAPFSAEQRTWLSGFFAGLISADGTVVDGTRHAGVAGGGSRTDARCARGRRRR